VRNRWFSSRAVSLHVAVLVFVPACALAAWWQVSRAADGNQLSYLYMVMWPVFGLLGIFFWWLLVHTDYDTVGLKGMRNRQASLHAEAAASVPVDRAAAASPVATTSSVASTSVPADPDVDPELAAYNERLAELAKEGPKTWRRPERIVARRTE
jgi:hypothetical protein